jgi:hypothetical protein
MTQSAEINPITRLQLAELHRHIPDYEANQSVTDALYASGKHLVPIVGPVGVGKTVYTEWVTRLDKAILPVNTTTNRHRKPSDPVGFKTADEGVTTEGLIEDIQNNEVVNYTVIPDTGAIYATFLDDFPGKYNVGPIVSDSVPMLRRARFEHLAPVYVVSPVEIWKGFIKKSLGDRADTISARAPEAIESLTYAQQHIEQLHFIENVGDTDSLVFGTESIIALARGDEAPTLPPEIAEQRLEEMIAYAKQLAVH